MPSPEKSDDSAIAGVLDRNIHAIIQKRKDEDRHLRWQDRLAMNVTGAIGSLRSVFLHILVFSTWGFCNSGLVPALKFDPGFSILDVLISIEAIFLSTFVLINQNRMAKSDARHSDLNLQVNLLAEHEVTHLIQLVTSIAAKMNLESAKNPELVELQKGIKPEQILEEIEIRHDKADRDSSQADPAGH